MSEGQEENSQIERFGALNREICSRLRERRHRAGLSMKAVEEQTGIANNTIAKLESGNMQATPKYLEALAPVYGCAPRDFLPPDESMPSVAEAALLVAIRGDDVEAIREATQAVIPAPTLSRLLGGRRLPSLAKQELIDAIEQATEGLSRIAVLAKSNALDSEEGEQK